MGPLQSATTGEASGPGAIEKAGAYEAHLPRDRCGPGRHPDLPAGRERGAGYRGLGHLVPLAGAGHLLYVSHGTRLYYEAAGTGHPFVLIHGGLVNRRLWDEQFPVFAQHYRVIRFDIRGFGDSAPPTPETPPYFLEEDIRGLLRFLGVEKTYVMGLSMGGALAINFTLMYPEMVEALIPVAMGLGGYEATAEDREREQWQQVGEAAQSGDIAQAVEITLRVWTDGPGRTPDQANPAVREKVRAMTTHNFELPEDDNATQPQELEPPAISRLAEIHVPTLIILGDQDVPSILKIADILEKGIPGATKVVIPDTAHHLPMERPEEFNRIVLDFLGSLAQ